MQMQIDINVQNVMDESDARGEDDLCKREADVMCCEAEYLYVVLCFKQCLQHQHQHRCISRAPIRLAPRTTAPTVCLQDSRLKIKHQNAEPEA